MKGKAPIARVSTESNQRAITEKGKKLSREDILLRLIGQGHNMVVNDISYHNIPCMNAFKATQVSTGRSAQSNLYADVALNHLLEQLEISLFQEKCGLLIKSLRNKFQMILREVGIKTANTSSQYH